MDINELKLSPEDYPEIEAKKKKNKQVNGYFIKGPIPLNWIQKACSLGGNVAKLAWLLWFYHGMTHGESFTVSNIHAADFNLNRHQKTQALSCLAEAGLIAMRKEKGKAPIVQLLEE